MSIRLYFSFFESILTDQIQKFKKKKQLDRTQVVLIDHIPEHSHTK